MMKGSLRSITRRHFFEQASFGIGGLALASLIDEALLAQGSRPPAYKFDYPPKVKRVIYLFMAGAPSQLDLFDPKPALTKHDGQDIPQELIKGERFAFIKGTPKLLASPFQFKRHGQSGAEISELLPHLSKLADQVTFVRSMQTWEILTCPAPRGAPGGGRRAPRRAGGCASAPPGWPRSPCACRR